MNRVSRMPWILRALFAAIAAPRRAVLGSAGRLGTALTAGRWHPRVPERAAAPQFSIRGGCLVRRDGQLPIVRDITSPEVLGVHRAAPSAALVAADGDGPVADVYPGPPAYVPRSFDGELAERMATGGFVLLVGDSAAGKSRAAFEAITSTLPGHTLICPKDRNAIAAAVGLAAAQRRCVLWLDSLERYLGAGGLTGEQVAELLGLGGRPPGMAGSTQATEVQPPGVAGSTPAAKGQPPAAGGRAPDLDDLPGQDGRHLVIVATIRRAEHARITGAAGPDTNAGLQVCRDARRVLYLAHPIRVARMLTSREAKRARARAWDPRIADALRYAASRGIAEHLAAGPELLRVWKDARGAAVLRGAEPSSGQPGPGWSAIGVTLGAALVSAAVDIRRAGYTSPLPRGLLDRARQHYLAGAKVPASSREAAREAWEWATWRGLAGTALLRRSGPDVVEVFDYLVDAAQRRAGCLGEVPEAVLQAAIDAAGPAEADSMAAAAFGEGRYDLAGQAWRKAYEERAGDKRLGPDHPDTLVSRSNLALALRAAGQLEEAEAEQSAAVTAMTRVLGPDYPDTLLGRGNLASLLSAAGRLEQAEAEHRAMLEIMTWMHGPDHPGVLTTRGNIASLLHAQGRLEEAEAEHRTVAEAMTRVLGPDHPDTLASRNNLASVLCDLGRLEEAEAEHRAELEACSRVLGPEHPDTLTSRSNLASVLRDQGRLEEAEAEYRAVAEAMTRVLGPDCREVLASRRDLAAVLRARGRLDQAEAEYRAVLDTAAAVLGPDHPDTISGRRSLALVLYSRGRLEEAEAEHFAVAEAMTRTLGPDHPDTLVSRGNLALVLYAQGLLEEAEAEHRSVAEAMSRTLGPDHPDTLASRGNLALTLRSLGRLSEAEAEHRAVLESRTRVLGPDHPDTLASRSNLAIVERSTGRSGKNRTGQRKQPRKAAQAAQAPAERSIRPGQAGQDPGERSGRSGRARQSPVEQPSKPGKGLGERAGRAGERPGKARQAARRPGELDGEKSGAAEAAEAVVLSGETVS
jgi:tetratricopeptide (TPR) repeat protein